jgi:predicted nuclease of predicted toxin-antitoxin system
VILYHLDEHVSPAIADGLRRRGIDASTTVEAGLRSATDEAHLAYAQAQGRVMVTCDRDFPDSPGFSGKSQAVDIAEVI